MTLSFQRKSLDLSDRPLLEPLLRSCKLQLSEYSFANLYLFRKVHQYELVLADYPFIQGVHYDKTPFVMPTSLECLEYLKKAQQALFPIPEEWLARFDTTLWEAQTKNEDSDYIYDTDILASYPGRHLSKKRNLVKQFNELYRARSYSLDRSQKEHAYQILATWRSHADHDLDFEAAREAIELLEELQLEGTIYYVEDNPVGFMLGEPLNDETFVIHFAKADISYKGIYQYIYQAFAQSLVGRYTSVNMEQDLGIASLRQSKHSYEPLKMAPKYTLFHKSSPKLFFS